MNLIDEHARDRIVEAIESIAHDIRAIRVALEAVVPECPEEDAEPEPDQQPQEVS